MDLIKELNPDLIIANKEENDEDSLRKLMPIFPVWISDIKRLEDALQMILSLGKSQIPNQRHLLGRKKLRSNLRYCLYYQNNPEEWPI